MDIYTTPAHRLRDLGIAPDEIVQLFLERAKADTHNAWTYLDLDAKVQGEGALYGIPMAIEDTIHVAGMPLTYGSLLLKENQSTWDADKITSVKAAGGVILGKTNVSEFALKDETDNKLYGPTRHPHTGQTCLGTSGGAAVAVATGSVPLAMGVDAMGGVRLSAADCKLFGLKISKWHRLLHVPHFKPPLEQDLSCRAIIARHPKDIQMVIDTFSHRKEMMLVEATHNEPTRLVGSLEPLDLPGYHVEPFEWPFDETVFSTLSSVMVCDRYLPLLALKQRDPNFLDLLDEISCEWFYAAQDVSGVDYSGALCFVQWVQDAVQILLRSYDFLITKVLPDTPSPSLIGRNSMLFPFNLSGHPSLVTPCGHQIITQYYHEAELLSFAEKYFN